MREDTALWLRFMGSFVMMLDTVMKYSYYSFSRFASAEIKEMYRLLIGLRPTLVEFLIGYIVWLKIKTYCVNRSKKNKKFKDDRQKQDE